MVKNIPTLDEGQENNGVWEAVFIYLFTFFSKQSTWSALGWDDLHLSAGNYQKKNDKDCTFLLAGAEVNFF